MAQYESDVKFFVANIFGIEPGIPSTYSVVGVAER